MSNVTEARADGSVMILAAVAEAVRDAGEIPAGTLYAVLMAQGCTLEQFDGLCLHLCGTGLVERRGDLLRWVGPPASMLGHAV